MEVLRAEKLIKHYGKNQNIVRALNNVNISVKNEEFVSITGTSGSAVSRMESSTKATSVLPDLASTTFAAL